MTDVRMVEHDGALLLACTATSMTRVNTEWQDGIVYGRKAPRAESARFR